MDIKKTVTIEGTRSWTGPMENYEAHKECVDHWCDGGDIEYIDQFNEWSDASSAPVFVIAYQYRIKRREPQNGEVWMVAETPMIRTNGHDWQWESLGGRSRVSGNHKDSTYLAPSVEAYIARNILSKINESEAADVQAYTAYNLLIEAAGEE